eukprot:TRINITY_DN1872_c0_g1_i3.p1 TRINITY_DN1872_c0_g1~~TRINITY_DN1872_c0_g1_i3.p1  ORF type:complete len:117 (-),score=20.89 TRINITY_DN1872_c0_g1_i3:104-454(-)
MRTGDGFLCVYSVIHYASFAEILSLHDHILRVKDCETTPIVLVGNKCDMEHLREVPKEKGTELSFKLNCKFMETSAKNRINVPEAFFELVHQIKQWRIARQPKHDFSRKKKTCSIL